MTCYHCKSSLSCKCRICLILIMKDANKRMASILSKLDRMLTSEQLNKGGFKDRDLVKTTSSRWFFVSEFYNRLDKGVTGHYWEKECCLQMWENVTKCVSTSGLYDISFFVYQVAIIIVLYAWRPLSFPCLSLVSSSAINRAQ